MCLCHNCLVISNRLWRHQQNVNWASETLSDVWRLSFLSSFMDSLWCVRNRIMYVLSWRTVYALTRVLFWCLFPELLCNSENKHQNNTRVSAKQFATRVLTLFFISADYVVMQGVEAALTIFLSIQAPKLSASRLDSLRLLALKWNVTWTNTHLNASLPYVYIHRLYK